MKKTDAPNGVLSVGINLAAGCLIFVGIVFSLTFYVMERTAEAKSLREAKQTTDQVKGVSTSELDLLIRDKGDNRAEIVVKLDSPLKVAGLQTYVQMNSVGYIRTDCEFGFTCFGEVGDDGVLSLTVLVDPMKADKPIDGELIIGEIVYSGDGEVVMLDTPNQYDSQVVLVGGEVRDLKQYYDNFDLGN